MPGFHAQELAIMIGILHAMEQSVMEYPEGPDNLLATPYIQKLIMHLVASVRLSVGLSVCLFVCALLAEPFDPGPRFLAAHSKCAGYFFLTPTL